MRRKKRDTDVREEKCTFSDFKKEQLQFSFPPSPGIYTAAKKQYDLIISLHVYSVEV